MRGSDFKDLRLYAVGSADAAARRLGVSTRTLRRWEDADKVPELAVIAMRALAGYCLGEGMDGWQAIRGYLISPGGLPVHKDDVCAVPYLKQLVSQAPRAPVQLDMLARLDADPAGDVVDIDQDRRKAAIRLVG